VTREPLPGRLRHPAGPPGTRLGPFARGESTGHHRSGPATSTRGAASQRTTPGPSQDRWSAASGTTGGRSLPAARLACVATGAAGPGSRARGCRGTAVPALPVTCRGRGPMPTGELASARPGRFWHEGRRPRRSAAASRSTWHASVPERLARRASGRKPRSGAAPREPARRRRVAARHATRRRAAPRDAPPHRRAAPRRASGHRASRTPNANERGAPAGRPVRLRVLDRADRGQPARLTGRGGGLAPEPA
jgi:hypothetical protein